MLLSPLLQSTFELSILSHWFKISCIISLRVWSFVRISYLNHLIHSSVYKKFSLYTRQTVTITTIQIKSSYKIFYKFHNDIFQWRKCCGSIKGKRNNKEEEEINTLYRTFLLFLHLLAFYTNKNNTFQI